MACNAVFPSDRNFRQLIEEQINSDLVGFAIHGRRAMERRGRKDASPSNDPLWPASSVATPNNLSLWEALGAIVHAIELQVCWERVDLEPSPFKGREAMFPGSVHIKSDAKALQIPIGSLVAAFFGNFLNKLSEQETKEAV